LRDDLYKAGREVDDLVWPLPMHRDFKKKFDSTIADIVNCDKGSSSYAGSQKGASFIDRFVGKNKWCHVDTGGTAFCDDTPQEFETKGATGNVVRLFVQFLENRK